MNATDVINRLTQLPQSERITLARRLLPLEPPREGTQIGFSHALSFVAQLPPKYRQSMISLLSESDKASNGNSLNIEDAMNMAHTLLMLTQDHEPRDVGGSMLATIPHDLILEASLQKSLNDWDCSNGGNIKTIGKSADFAWGIPGV